MSFVKCAWNVCNVSTGGPSSNMTIGNVVQRSKYMDLYERKKQLFLYPMKAKD